MRLTGVVARINIDRWEERMLNAMNRIRLEVYLFTKYVDDVNMAVSTVPEGWIWKAEIGGWQLGRDAE